MYLKKIEMQGFKSFAEKTVLEFKPGITAVIGPNGSGKSNISDAIRWVLGEQSMKALRGTSSEDVIFAGTQTRKSLGFAEVSIVLDNEDHSLPIEFNEVTVTRKIYRSGETGYFINKTPCRLKDITELFMDTGIGKDGYSIIGQGKIDEILSNKSEERRHIFEEAAGIIKYRTRRDETEKKLEQTKVNLIRINDIISEIENNLEPMKVQAEKAKKYLELREELKTIEVGLYLYKIEKIKEKIEEQEKNIKIFEEQNVNENSKLEQMQNEKEKLKEELNQINEQIEKIQTLGFESKNQIEKINSNINISNERILNNTEEKNRLEIEIQEALKNIQELEEDKENRKLKKENLKANREKFEKELEQKLKELEKKTETLSKKEIEIEAKKKVIEELTEEKYNIKNEQTESDTNKENSKERKGIQEKELVKVISELDKKRDEKNLIVKEFNESETIKNKLKKELQEIQDKKVVIDGETTSFETQIQTLVDEKRLKTSKHDFLVETEKEKEGYVRSVKDLLKACENNLQLKKGINGVLANLISTDEKYQTAIEMALGGAIQNIVTDTEEDAKKMIEYLRKNNLGRASFLPISSVKGRKLDRFKQESGVVGIASDLVKYSSKYENIILNLLGKIVITDNIESAIRLSRTNGYAFKIVTLEGDVINPSGAMTGGSVSKKTASLLGRTTEIKNLEKQILDIDKKLEDIVTKKEKFLKENESVIAKIEEINDKLQQSEIKCAKQSEKVISIENEISKIENSKIKLENEIKKINEDIKNFDNNKIEFEIKINEITEKIEKITNEISEFTALNKDDQLYIDNLNEDITNLKISVSSFDESNTSIEEMIERISTEIENNNKEIENKKDKIEKGIKQNEELKATIKELEDSIEKIKAEIENSDGKAEELKKSRQEKTEKIEQTETDISKQFEIIQDIKAQIVKIDVKNTSLKQEANNIVNDLWNDYEITPNNAKEFEKPSNIQETEKKVSKIHNQIKEIGNINVDAIEEYKSMKERYETMTEQRLDMETTMSKLRNIIQEMTSTMKNQFMEKFELINKNFNEVFVQLFGGGKAELILEDKENILECGIDIKAQPTGKALKNMISLSGGERALTAIALLFAILKINPAPFCTLDEIEAALDDVNIYRYADFLKKFSMETQFLIITHRKGTMEAANTVYGVTMEENGVSKLLSIKLNTEM